MEKPEPADCLLFLTTTDTYLEHTTNLSVTRSKARGVCVGSQSGVTIRYVSIQDTVSRGILCEGHGGWNVRVRTGVTFERSASSEAARGWPVVPTARLSAPPSPRRARTSSTARPSRR